MGLTPEKEALISKIYSDPAGFGSIKQTFIDVKKRDPKIKYEDVAAWFNKHRNINIKVNRYNSYVANAPKEQYQTDLFFLNDLEQQKFKIGLLMIDIFSKKMAVVPIADKTLGSVLAGIMECINKLGGYPQTLMSDEEPAITAKGVVDFLAEKGTRLITSRTHAPFSERAVRTFKSMLYKRIDASDKENPQWTDYIFQILLTYNNKLVHSATGLTPAQAEEDKNQIIAWGNMEMKAKHNRKYTTIEVGDRVRIYKKKKLGFQKERTPLWSELTYEIESVDYFMGNPFYKLKGLDRSYARFEILKVG